MKSYREFVTERMHGKGDLDAIEKHHGTMSDRKHTKPNSPAAMFHASQRSRASILKNLRDRTGPNREAVTSPTGRKTALEIAARLRARSRDHLADVKDKHYVSEGVNNVTNAGIVHMGKFGKPGNDAACGHKRAHMTLGHESFGASSHKCQRCATKYEKLQKLKTKLKEDYIMEHKLDSEAQEAHDVAVKRHGKSIPEIKYKNRSGEDMHVKLGDGVGFKSDHEQYGQVAHIRRHPVGGHTLTLHSKNGFSGDYLRYANTTEEHSHDVWK